ncbi:hypothetical protein [Priestia megaterium]|uniref:hypothetical protein n=1 Tax=Priestia megaterium TaxID=1404 RepID=UPI00188E85FC|nr:hypothetical protein [Priestia megaterium]
MASARSYLSDLECDDFGQLIFKHDEDHLQYLKWKFLQGSLAHYNYAIDISWQVLWFYLGDNSFLFMNKPKLYEKYSTRCSMDRLEMKLKICNMTEMKEHINTFFNSKTTLKLRELYNYIKHRGSLNINKSEEWQTHFSMSCQDKVSDRVYLPTMIARRNFDLEELRQTLIDFDISFHDYFEKIISLVMPKDFIDTKYNFNEAFTHCFTRMDFEDNDLESYEKRFLAHINEFYPEGIRPESVKQYPMKYVE